MNLTLKDLEDAARVCLRDGRCAYGPWPEGHILCPLYLREPSFTFTGGGYLFLVLALLEGKIDLTEEVADFAYSCSGCLSCDENCHIIASVKPEIGIVGAIRVLRSEAVRKGLMPQPIRMIYEEVRSKGDFGRPWRAVFQKQAAGNGETPFVFAECVHSEGTVRALEAFERLLGKMGVPASFLGTKGCCGASLYEYGLWNRLPELIEENCKALADKEVCFLNPHCQYFVERVYARVVPDFHVRATNVVQFLLAALSEGRLIPRRKGKVRVSYHDPCYLGRGLGMYEEPRQILSLLDGVELIEVGRNRESSFCCGSRIMGNYLSRLSEETAEERVREFKETGADLLVTACGDCVDSLGRFFDRERIRHIVEFVDERT